MAKWWHRSSCPVPLGHVQVAVYAPQRKQTNQSGITICHWTNVITMAAMTKAYRPQCFFHHFITPSYYFYPWAFPGCLHATEFGFGLFEMPNSFLNYEATHCQFVLCATSVHFYQWNQPPDRVLPIPVTEWRVVVGWVDSGGGGCWECINNRGTISHCVACLVSVHNLCQTWIRVLSGIHKTLSTNKMKNITRIRIYAGTIHSSILATALAIWRLLVHTLPTQ